MRRSAIKREAHRVTNTAGGKDGKPSFPIRSVVFIIIERLSIPCVDRGIRMAARVKSFRISKQLLYFH